MKRWRLKAGHDPSTPQEGDKEVTLRVHEEQGTIEQRYTLLTYAFVKVVQGAVLRQVQKFDLINGEMRFIVGDSAVSSESLRGRVTADIEGVEIEEHEVSNNG